MEDPDHHYHNGFIDGSYTLEGWKTGAWESPAACLEAMEGRYRYQIETISRLGSAWAERHKSYMQGWIDGAREALEKMRAAEETKGGK